MRIASLINVRPRREETPRRRAIGAEVMLHFGSAGRLIHTTYQKQERRRGVGSLPPAGAVRLCCEAGSPCGALMVGMEFELISTAESADTRGAPFPCHAVIPCCECAFSRAA